MNKQAELFKSIPKYTLNLIFDNIGLELEENQFREMLHLLQRTSLYQRGYQVPLALILNKLYL